MPSDFLEKGKDKDKSQQETHLPSNFSEKGKGKDKGKKEQDNLTRIVAFGEQSSLQLLSCFSVKAAIVGPKGRNTRFISQQTDVHIHVEENGDIKIDATNIDCLDEAVTLCHELIGSVRATAEQEFLLQELAKQQ